MNPETILTILWGEPTPDLQIGAEMPLTRDEQNKFEKLIKETKGLSISGNRERSTITLSYREVEDLIAHADTIGLDFSNCLKRIVQDFLQNNLPKQTNNSN